MRERIVQGKVPEAVETVVGALPDGGEQCACTRAATIAVEVAAELERVRTLVPGGHVAPLLVVLNEDSVGESLTVAFDARNVDPRDLPATDWRVALGMLPRP